MWQRDGSSGWAAVSRLDRASGLGRVGPWPRLLGPVGPKPRTPGPATRDACGTGPVERGLWAPSLKWPRRPAVLAAIGHSGNVASITRPRTELVAGRLGDLSKTVLLGRTPAALATKARRSQAMARAPYPLDGACPVNGSPDTRTEGTAEEAALVHLRPGPEQQDTVDARNSTDVHPAAAPAAAPIVSASRPRRRVVSAGFGKRADCQRDWAPTSTRSGPAAGVCPDPFMTGTGWSGRLCPGR
jgi:hypothetical protein